MRRTPAGHPHPPGNGWQASMRFYRIQRAYGVGAMRAGVRAAGVTAAWYGWLKWRWQARIPARAVRRCGKDEGLTGYIDCLPANPPPNNWPVNVRIGR
jgi:hypothetical protein